MATKIVIPTDLAKKDLFKFLKDNKSALINQKKSFIKETEPISFIPEYYTSQKEGTKKALSNDTAIPEDAMSVFVKMVCNACNWCDSQMDVLLKNSAKRTIQQRKGMIPHLADHTQKLGAQIGDVQDVYLEDISMKDLGSTEAGSTQCIIMESIVKKAYDEKVFLMYKNKKVNQHSIGLRYVELYLAINEPENEYFLAEYGIWKKYYDVILNKEVVDEAGFFWAVKEIQMLENSGVLFASNELTPTLDTRAKSHSPKPAEKSASEGDPETELVDSGWDVNAAIITTKFF